MKNIGIERTEAKVKQFIKRKHPRLELIFFRMMYKEVNVWILDGEVKFKCAIFFNATRSFKTKIDAYTGEIASYEETNVHRAKK